MSDLKDVVGDYETFINKMIVKVKAEGFDFKDFVQLDVLCYKTASKSSYAVLKEKLNSVGVLLVEAEVGGRPIATFRLDKSIYCEGWRIDTIELPAPKEDDQAEGLDHIQFVLFSSLEDFMRKYSDKEFDTKAMGRATNPMITYRFDEGLSVKFHILSLASAIYIESKLRNEGTV